MGKAKITFEIPGKETVIYETDAFVAIVNVGEDLADLTYFSTTAETVAEIVLKMSGLCKKLINDHPPVRKLLAVRNLAKECRRIIDDDYEDDDEEELEDDEEFDI